MLASVWRLAIAGFVLVTGLGCCNIPGRGWNRECCNTRSCFCYAPKLESCAACRNSCVECKRCCETGPVCPWLQSRPCGFCHWLVHGVTWGQSADGGDRVIDVHAPVSCSPRSD